MTYIEFDDIQAGDIIRVTYSASGVLVEHTGTVEAVNTLAGIAYTKESGHLWNSGWDTTKPVFKLIDRPKPPLPTEPGTVVLSWQPVELGEVPLILRDGKWWYLNGESCYHVSSVQDRPWKLAKVVEA